MQTSLGANLAPYTPREPIAEKTLAAFEAKHGVTLPADYRDTLLHLGIGFGPDSGLLPLASHTPTEMPQVTVTITNTDGSITGSASTGARPPLNRAAIMAKPFPLTEKFEVGAPLPSGDAHLYDGTLELTDMGCGYMMLLAITGPQSGTVWEDVTAADIGIIPHGTFRTWLDRWLDHALAWIGQNLALAIPTHEAPKRALAVLTAAQPRIEAIGAQDAVMLARAAHVRISVGDRKGALAVLSQVREHDVPPLRTRIYAKEIAAVSRARSPAVEHANHIAREVRVALAGNPSTPAKVIEALTHDADPEVRSRAARHPNAAPEVLERVAREGLATIGELGVDSAVLIELAVRNPAASRALVEEAATAALGAGSASGGIGASNSDPDRDRARAIVLRGIALAPACPPELRARLATSPWPEVRHAVAACRETSEPVLRALASDSNTGVRMAIAARRDAPPDVLRAFVADPALYVRSAVAMNPRTPALALADLARTGEVLYSLAHNSALPAELVAAFAHLAEYDAMEYEPEAADVPVIRAWIDEVDMDGRPSTIPAADVIAIVGVRHWSYPDVALAAVFGAHMGSYNIASRPWLSAEMIERCAGDSYAYARGSIAQRSDVDERVLARLAADPSEITRQSAAANSRLALHELLALVEDENEMVREAVAMNPATPVEHRARLVGDEHPYTRRGVARSPNATVGELSRLANDKSEDVRKWVPWACGVTPALLAQLATDTNAQVAGRAKYRIAVDAFAATLEL
jgi:hypothetical protein